MLTEYKVPEDALSETIDGSHIVATGYIGSGKLIST